MRPSVDFPSLFITSQNTIFVCTSSRFTDMPSILFNSEARSLARWWSSQSRFTPSVRASIPGAAITPCYVQYHTKDPPTDLLLLLGLPKIPELVQIINEATQLVNLHSGASPLKQSWFMRSKGVQRKELVDAIADFRELFSYYMTPGAGGEPQPGM